MNVKNIKPIAVLVSICIVVAALLGAVNLLTKDVIAENAIRKEQESLRKVLSGGDIFEEISIGEEDGIAGTVKTVYRETKGVGYVVLVNTRTEYSSGDMAISIGISKDGKVVGALVTNYQESKDMGKKTYPEKFVGTSLNDYQNVDTVSGVTYSSSAFKAAVGDALRAVALLSAKESAAERAPALLLSSTEERTLPEGSSDVNEVFPNNSFVKLTLDEAAPTGLVALYRNQENNTVIAHLVVAGEWVPIATEAFVTFNSLGRITDMKLTQWVVGHGVEPDQSFVDGFVGKYDSTVDFTDLVSGATGTSLDLRNAISLAAQFVTEGIDKSAPSFHFPEEEWTPVTLGADAPAYLSALYESKTSGRVVAHVIVPGEWVPVASEAFILYNELGRIVDFRLTKWIVGHGVYPDQSFIDGFVGRYEGDVDYVDLVSGATGTSVDLRNAVSDISDYIVRGVDTSSPAHHFPEEEWTPVKLGADAPEYLAALYKSKTSDRVVAHVIVPGEWVPVASEAFIMYNRWGTIVDFRLTQWVVGHGVEPDQSFIDGFIGKSIEAVGETDLVSGATGTSLDLRNTVSEVSEYLSFDKASHTALGIVLLVVIILSIAAVIVIPKVIVYRKARNSK